MNLRHDPFYQELTILWLEQICILIIWILSEFGSFETGFSIIFPTIPQTFTCMILHNMSLPIAVTSSSSQLHTYLSGTKTSCTSSSSLTHASALTIFWTTFQACQLLFIASHLCLAIIFFLLYFHFIVSYSCINCQLHCFYFISSCLPGKTNTQTNEINITPFYYTPHLQLWIQMRVKHRRTDCCTLNSRLLNWNVPLTLLGNQINFSHSIYSLNDSFILSPL